VDAAVLVVDAVPTGLLPAEPTLERARAIVAGRTAGDPHAIAAGGFAGNPHAIVAGRMAGTSHRRHRCPAPFEGEDQ